MLTISPGKNPPAQINVYVEIPQDSGIKYELDRDSGVMFVDRFLYTAYKYPFNYGFIPGTMAEDGDPVDVLVLSGMSVHPGIVIPCVPVAMLEMEDEEGIDTKILAVPTAKVDPLYGVWKSVDDVPDAIKNKIKNFFEHYKELEPGKWVKIKEWKGQEAAFDAITKALK